MEDLNDEKIQEMLEKDAAGIAEGDGDVQAYALLFKALAREPEIPLSPYFSARVTATILAKKNRHSDLRLFVLIATGLIIFLLGTYYYLETTGAPTSQLILTLLKYKWILFFGVAALCIIQFLDQKLSTGKTADSLSSIIM